MGCVNIFSLQLLYTVHVSSGQYFDNTWGSFFFSFYPHSHRIPTTFQPLHQVTFLLYIDCHIWRVIESRQGGALASPLSENPASTPVVQQHGPIQLEVLAMNGLRGLGVVPTSSSQSHLLAL